MALPYELEVECKAISDNVGDDHAQADPDFAYVRFAKHADETAADEIQERFSGGPESELILRIHQAQKADFSVGTKYVLSLDVPAV